jgi:hypothetical protein
MKKFYCLNEFKTELNMLEEFVTTSKKSDDIEIYDAFKNAFNSNQTIVYPKRKIGMALTIITIVSIILLLLINQFSPTEKINQFILATITSAITVLLVFTTKMNTKMYKNSYTNNMVTMYERIGYTLLPSLLTLLIFCVSPFLALNQKLVVTVLILTITLQISITQLLIVKNNLGEKND